MTATPERYLARPTCNGRIFELADAAAEFETERLVRAGVLARNPAGRALLQRLGFESVSTTTVRMTSEQEVIVLERDL
jgi:hypothetical protein